MGKENGFSRWNLLLEKTLCTFEMTRKCLDYYINVIEKAAAGFERTGSNSE